MEKEEVTEELDRIIEILKSCVIQIEGVAAYLHLEESKPRRRATLQAMQEVQNGM